MNDNKCASCGYPAEKISSGVPECWRCWNLRKLDLPAARHWAKVGEEFLSNVDFYDWETYFPACGLTREEMKVMLVAAQKVRDHSKTVVERGYRREDVTA